MIIGNSLGLVFGTYIHIIRYVAIIGIGWKMIIGIGRGMASAHHYLILFKVLFKESNTYSQQGILWQIT